MTDADAKDRVRRFDYVSSLKPPERLDNGFLKVEGRIARIGVQEYRDGQGGVRRELRIPEEVFDAESLASFALMPLCNTHPPMLLTAETAKQYAVGSVGEPTRDGDFVRAPILIHDAAAIGAAEGGRAQLSNGYTCELDPMQDEALTERYGKYDFIQRDIRGNHVAIVDTARAGSEARMRLDDGDAEAVEVPEFVPPPVLGVGFFHTTHRETLTMPHKFKLDGFDIAVEDPNMQALIERPILIAKETAEKEKTRADAAQKALAEADKARADLQKTLSESQAKLDAMVAKAKADAAKMVECDECGGTGKVDGETCENCEGEGEVPAKEEAEDDDPGSETQVKGKAGGKRADSISSKRAASRQRVINRLANARAGLVVEATKHLGTNEKFDDLSDMDIKRRVIAKLAKDAKLEKGVLRVDGDSVDDTYVNVRYGIEIKQAAKNTVRPIDAARLMATGNGAFIPRVDEQPSGNPEAARQAMNARALAANVKNARSQ